MISLVYSAVPIRGSMRVLRSGPWPGRYGVTKDATMPKVRRILETALYVEDLNRAAEFYERVLGLRALVTDRRLVAMDAGEGTVLLLFRRSTSSSRAASPGGWIPPHDGRGPLHFALAVDAAALDSWRRHLLAEGIDIESEVTWKRGGTSLYFRDPDGHSVELATPGIWEIY